MSDFFDKTKVTKFNCCLFLDEHVLRLYVPMEKPVTVDIVQCRCYLLYDVSYLFMGEWIIIQLPHLHHPVQVHI